MWHASRGNRRRTRHMQRERQDLGDISLLGSVATAILINSNQKSKVWVSYPGDLIKGVRKACRG